MLIVYDASIVRTLLQKKLNELLPINCSVHVACDGGEALSLSLKKTRVADTPVVMLTCNGSTWNKVKVKLAKCDDYLKKSPKEADLQAMVLKYIPQLEGLLNEITAIPDTAANF
jgi:CheY-like chemotaxis protein